MSELKKCPFCGGGVVVTQFGNDATKKRGFYVRCRACSTELRQEAVNYTLDWLRPKVLEMWNRRSAPDSVVQLYKALTEDSPLDVATCIAAVRKEFDL